MCFRRSQLSPTICSSYANTHSEQVLFGHVCGCLEAKSLECISTPGLCLISTGKLDTVLRKVLVLTLVLKAPRFALLKAATTGWLSVKCVAGLLLSQIYLEKCSRTSLAANASPSHAHHIALCASTTME